MMRNGHSPASQVLIGYAQYTESTDTEIAGTRIQHILSK
ncbi:hypothetical protein NIES22_58830 [Calothrix brevissima NIES-22]|nr:hypothetical protein NIES22_58830 [Calothrix brevissima NIES-22]